jgi:hypothetical protein
VDVDNDDSAEIIVMENNYAFQCLDGTPSTTGLHVFGHPRGEWVRTRRIWNQHTYHVTNIDEDGRVPLQETPNWVTPRLNNFRQNVQPEGLFNAPDLVLEDLGVSLTTCPRALTPSVRVQNRGSAGVPAGIPVAFYRVDSDGARELAGIAHTTAALLPGESELVALDSVPVDANAPSAAVAFEAVVNDPSRGPVATLHECRADNNGSGRAEGRCPNLL